LKWAEKTHNEIDHWLELLLCVYLVSDSFFHFEFVAQLQELRKISLARVICDNGDDTKVIQAHALLRPSESNPVVDCGQIAQMDYSVWKDTSPGKAKAADLQTQENVFPKSNANDDYAELNNEFWEPDSSETDQNSTMRQKPSTSIIINLRAKVNSDKNNVRPQNITKTSEQLPIQQLITKPKLSKGVQHMKTTSTKNGVRVQFEEEKSS